MRRRLLVVLLVLAGLLVPTAASARAFPDTIALPDGFFPEGIATRGRTAYVGSLVDGAIVRQDLVRGTTTAFAESPGPDAIAVGMDVDRRGRLWVAGGGPGLSPDVASGYRVYDRHGTLLVDQPVPQAGFVNDVIVTRDAAWFTDSFQSQLIRVPIGRRGAIGEPELVALAGDWEAAAGFNANGIAARGRTLVVAQSTAPDGDGAALYRVPADRAADALDAQRIELDATLPGADGLVLLGRRLYVVAGGSGVVEVTLARRLTSGHITDVLEVPGAISPTTAARFGGRLYVVDAKFPLFGDPTVPFVTTAIRR